MNLLNLCNEEIKQEMEKKESNEVEVAEKTYEKREEEEKKQDLDHKVYIY